MSISRSTRRWRLTRAVMAGTSALAVVAEQRGEVALQIEAVAARCRRRGGSRGGAARAAASRRRMALSRSSGETAAKRFNDERLERRWPQRRDSLTCRPLAAPSPPAPVSFTERRPRGMLSHGRARRPPPRKPRGTARRTRRAGRREAPASRAPPNRRRGRARAEESDGAAGMRRSARSPPGSRVPQLAGRNR